MTAPRRSGLLSSTAPPPVQAKGVVHELVAETAKDFARAIWEEGASTSNEFYKLWPSQEGFVRVRWQTFIQPAREHLAELLNPLNHSMTTPAMREQIHQAILLNAAANPAVNSPLDW